MRTEEEIRAAVAEAEKAINIFVEERFKGVEIPSTVALQYLVYWARKNILGDPELQEVSFFFCFSHKKGYTQPDDKGNYGLGCPICRDKQFNLSK